MVAQTVVTKVITAGATLLLGKLLLDDSFGLAALVYVFSVVPSLIQQWGLREVLVQRHRHFGRWANPAFWMSVTQGLGAGVLMAALAPVAGRMYHSQTLPGLMLLLAITYPIDALQTLPRAKMQNDLRFRFIAWVEWAGAVGQAGLSILFAWLGFGAYSLLLPRPIVTVILVLVYWLAAPVRVRWRLQTRRWHFLVGDSWLVLVSNACVLIMFYADYFILSRFRDMSEVGQYYFAFNLSLQATVLLTQNLSTVLFPALTKLQDEPTRQIEAFLRAVRMMSFVTFPACLAQAALAEPVLRLVYGHKWDAAILVLQLLSIGMTMRAVGAPAASLLNAQGRFVVRMRVSIILLALFVVMVTFGAWARGAVGVAMAVGLHTLLLEPLQVLVATQPLRPGLALRALLGPLLVAIGCVLPAWLVSQALPASWSHRDAWRVVIVVLITGALYLPAIRLIAPEAWTEGRLRLGSLVARGG